MWPVAIWIVGVDIGLKNIGSDIECKCGCEDKKGEQEHKGLPQGRGGPRLGQHGGSGDRWQNA